MGRWILFVVLPFVAIALLFGASALMLHRRWRIERAAVRRAARLVEPDIVTPPRDAPQLQRPWWGRPWLWIGISAGFVVLGLVVWPGLFGGIFLFVPFVWLSRPRTPTVDPRSNGHTRREGPL